MTVLAEQFGLLPASTPGVAVLAAAAGAMALWIGAHWPARSIRAWKGGPVIEGICLLVLVMLGAGALTLLAQTASRMLVLATSWPLWTISLLAASATETALLLYRLERRAVKPWAARTLAVLRAAVILSVAALLTEPVIAWSPTETLTREVAVMVDHSASMDVAQAQLRPHERVRLAEAVELVQRPVRLDAAAREVHRLGQRATRQSEQLAVLSPLGPDVLAKRLPELREGFKTQWSQLIADVYARVDSLEALAISDAAAKAAAAGAAAVLRDQVRPQLDGARRLLDAADAKALATGHAQMLTSTQAAQKALAAAGSALAAAGIQADDAFYASLDSTQRASVDTVTTLPRSELARRVLTREGGLLEQVGRRYKVRFYTFARSATDQDLSEWSKPTAPGGGAAITPQRQHTDLSAAMEQALSDIPSERLAGVILVTDGRHNAPSDPRRTAARLGALHVPVCGVLAGGIDPPCDAAIVAIEAPESASIKDKVRVAAEVKLDGLAGREVKVTLSAGKRLVETRTLKADGPAWRRRIEFSDQPPEKGLVTYTLQAEACEGEVIGGNNIALATVNVTNDRTKLLLVENRPRWEFRFLKNLFTRRDKSVQLQYLLVRPDRVADAPLMGAVPASATRKFELSQATALPTGDEEWMKFDAIILGDVPPSALAGKAMASLNKFVNDRGGTLVVIAGPSSMPHAYAGTVLEKMLPVTFTRVESALYADEPGYRFALTAAGSSRDFMMLGSPDGRQSVWGAMPPLYWRHRLVRSKPGATTLAYAVAMKPAGNAAAPAPTNAPSPEQGANLLRRQQEDNPLIVAHNIGWGKVLLLAFDRTWRLRYGEGDKYHHQFWGQVLRWATAGKLPAGTDLVKIGTDRQRYDPDSQIHVRAKLLTADLSPIVSGDVRATIFQGDRQVATTSLRHIADSAGMYAGSMGPLSPGEYRVQLAAPAARDSLKKGGVETVSTEIVVEAASGSEQVDLESDRATLSSLADMTGGRVEELAAAQTLIDTLAPDTLTRTTRKQIALWHHWIVLVLIVLLGTAEWLIRKKEGLP